MKKQRENGLTDEQEAARVAGLKMIGCKPGNHPDWFTAFNHKCLFARLVQKQEETLDKYRPKVRA